MADQQQQTYNQGGYELINSRWNAPAPTAAEVALRPDVIEVPDIFADPKSVKRIVPAAVAMTGFDAEIAAQDAAEKKEANRLVAVAAREKTLADAVRRGLVTVR